MESSSPERLVYPYPVEVEKSHIVYQSTSIDGLAKFPTVSTGFDSNGLSQTHTPPMYSASRSFLTNVSSPLKDATAIFSASVSMLSSTSGSTKGGYA